MDSVLKSLASLRKEFEILKAHKLISSCYNLANAISKEDPFAHFQEMETLDRKLELLDDIFEGNDLDRFRYEMDEEEFEIHKEKYTKCKKMVNEMLSGCDTTDNIKMEQQKLLVYMVGAGLIYTSKE